MSETYINTAMGLTDIPTINFTDVNIGTSINDNFNSINSNFDKILKSEYLRGRAGSNMTAMVCEFTGRSTATSLGVLYTYKESGQIKTSELTNRKLENLLKDAIKTHFSLLDNDTWLSKLFAPPQKYKLVFIVEADEMGNKTIVSSLPYNFTDPDLLTNYKKLNNPTALNDLNEFEDKSCVIYFDINDEGVLEAHVYDQIPTIYFDNFAKDFCWKINGEKTGISAKGIPGKQGSKGSSFLLGKFEYEKENDIAAEKMQLSHIFYYDESTTDEGKWYNLDPGYKNGTELKTLKSICNLENGAPLMVFGVKKNTTTVRDTKLLMGILRETNDKYYLLYDISTCDVGGILSRIDYWNCLQDSKTFFIPNRNSDGNITHVNDSVIASGANTYMVGHFFETSEASNNEIVLSLGANIYGVDNDEEKLINIANILGTSFGLGTGLPSAIKSSLNLNYDKVNCNHVYANRLNVGRSTTSIPYGLVVHGGDINIKSYVQTDKDGLTSKLTGGNLNIDGTITADDSNIIIGNGAGNITTKSLRVLESMSIAKDKILSSGGTAAFEGNMWLGGVIGHINGVSPLIIKEGIILDYKEDPTSNVSGKKTALRAWLPSKDQKYQFRFSNSYVFLDETSYLHVKGSSGYNGIIADSDITTDGRLKSKKGIEVNLNKDQSDASVKLYCPTVIGNSSGNDNHTIQGKTINLKGNVDISEGNTLAIHGFTSTRSLSVTQDLSVNGSAALKNNVTIGANNSNTHAINGDVTAKHNINVLGNATLNSNTTLGNSPSHVHTIHGKIVIEDWLATDEMINDIFN